MAELGAGSGTGYPTTLDTDTTVEANEGEAGASLQRAECINDANAAIVAIETELGTTPSSGYTNISGRLDAVDIPSKDLIIKYAGTATVDIDATHICVQGFKKESLNLTVDITASGANGLDTGSEAVSTWYTIWVICNPSTLAFAGILTAGDSPTMPAGYTLKRLVSYVYNNAGGHFVAFTHIGDVYRYDAGTEVVTAGGSTNTLDIDLSAVIPDGVKEVFGKTLSNGGALTWFANDVTFDNSISVDNVVPQIQIYFGGANECYNWRLLVTEEWTIYHQKTGQSVDIKIMGFTTREAY